MNLWINVYSNNVKQLSDFYLALGFSPNPKFKNTEREASFVFNQTTLMIFKEGFFNQAFPAKMSTPQPTPTCLFSIDMPTIEAAESLVNKAVKLGGKDLKVIPSLKNKGFYNTGFIDLDGHLWNILVS